MRKAETNNNNFRRLNIYFDLKNKINDTLVENIFGSHACESRLKLIAANKHK